MVDRSQPLVVTPRACPFVALDGDRDQRLDTPDPMHRCFAEPTPKARSIGHQASYCLAPAFTGCPIFLDWASRVAADLAEPGPVSPASPALAGLPAGAAVTSIDSVAPPRVATSAWIAEAMPPPESVETAARRTARLDIDPGGDRGAMPGGRAYDDATASSALVSSTQTPSAPRPPTRPYPDATVSIDDEYAAELAASRARTDLLGGLDEQPGPDTGDDASVAPDDETADALPSSRNRPRVPMDAGAPASLGPQTRPGVRPPGPREWEGGRRFEAYAARGGSRRLDRPVLVAIAVALVAVALLLVFLIPGLFMGTSGVPASPTAAQTSVVGTAPPTRTARPGATPRGPAATAQSYRVRRGDTLSSIGRKFGRTVVQLTCANKIRNPNSVPVGSTLIIPIDSYQCPRPTKKPQKTP